MLSEKASDAAEKGSILGRWTNWCVTRSDKTGSGTQLAVAMQLLLIGDHKRAMLIASSYGVEQRVEDPLI